MPARPGTLARALAATLLVGRAAAAQGTLERVQDDLDSAADDIIHIWTAPFRFSDSDLPPLIALTETTVLVGVVDGRIQAWLDAHPRSVPMRALAPFRNSRPLSLLGYTRGLLSLSGALYAGGLLLGADDLREAGIGCATADIANTFARHLIARLVGRLRPQYDRGPYVFKPFSFGDWPLRSFPGGHAANIMACTSFWSNRFDLGIAEPVLYLLAVAVGLGRVPDGAHWLSDTAFAFAFGWLVGDEVAERSARRDAASSGDAAPAAGRAAAPRLYIGWRIAF